MAPAAQSKGLTKLEAALKMVSTKGLATTNMHLFDSSGRIKKYESPQEIIDEFCTVRLDGYVRRRAHLIAACAEEIKVLSNKARFIGMVNAEELKLGNKSDEVLDAELERLQFDRIGSDEDESESSKTGYGYLLGMKLSSLTQRRKDELDAQLATKRAQLAALEASSAQDLWLTDLKQLKDV